MNQKQIMEVDELRIQEEWYFEPNYEFEIPNEVLVDALIYDSGAEEERRDVEGFLVEPVAVCVEPVFAERLPVVADDEQERGVHRAGGSEAADETPERAVGVGDGVEVVGVAWVVR